jgi:hypothetical protein
MTDAPESGREATMAAILRLVENEGASVTILCENPEGVGPDNHAVEVCDDWTNWGDRRFYGQTRLEALLKAETARLAASQEQDDA